MDDEWKFDDRARGRGRGCSPRILVMSDGATFLEKPFTVDGLLQTVRTALDAGASSGRPWSAVADDAPPMSEGRA